MHGQITVTLDDSRKLHFKRAYFATAMNLPFEGGGFTSGDYAQIFRFQRYGNIGLPKDWFSIRVKRQGNTAGNLHFPHLTKDGRLVVFHDDTLERICGRPDTVDNGYMKNMFKDPDIDNRKIVQVVGDKIRPS